MTLSIGSPGRDTGKRPPPHPFMEPAPGWKLGDPSSSPQFRALCAPWRGSSPRCETHWAGPLSGALPRLMEKRGHLEESLWALCSPCPPLGLCGAWREAWAPGARAGGRQPRPRNFRKMRAACASCVCRPASPGSPAPSGPYPLTSLHEAHISHPNRVV